MSVIGGASQGGGVVDTGDIGHSLRLRSSNSAYLSRTFGAGDRQKYTLSLWIKRGALVDGTLFKVGSGSAYDIFQFSSGSFYYQFNNGSVGYTYQTSSVERDPTSHMHVVLAIDTTQALDENRVKISLNGEPLSRSAGGIPQNTQTITNAAGLVHYIGSNSAVNLFFDGHLSRVCFIDGAALDPSAFGYLNTENNAWTTKSQSAVKAVVDAGGSNSFMLDFDNGTSLTTLGYDKSSKGNNWTLNNLSLTPGVTYDWMMDTPSNNFAVLNPIQPGASAISQASSYVATNTATVGVTSSTMRMTSGKYYAECICQSIASSGGAVGVATGTISDKSNILGQGANAANEYVFANNAGLSQKGNANTFTSYGSAFVTNDIIGVAFDATAGTLEFFKNGVSQGVAFSSVPAGDYAFVCCDNDTANQNGYYWNFGQRPFAYTPPTGFKALCTANLPDGEAITTSGTFTGNANANGPYVDIKGVPLAMTINGNAVTFGTHADKTAMGFKVRSSSSSYNSVGSNTYSITSTGAKRKYSNAQGNP